MTTDTPQPEFVDATAEEEPTTVALAVREPPTLTVAPQVAAEELGKRLEVIKQAMQNEMVDGVDYGKVPGTDKPTLLKPGAEKLSVLFQLDVQLVNEKQWGPDSHLTVDSKATVFHALTGTRLGFGEGMCSTQEKKYAKRRAQRVCPDCGQPQIRKSKHDPEFYCWAKQGGCGAKFPLNDERITGQEEGEVENPDLPDYWNTVVKMAAKRARVDAILAVTGASALFTQDAEDMASPQPDPGPPNDPAHPFGPAYDQTIGRTAGAACVKLAGGDPAAGVALWKQIQGEFGGYMPQAAAITLITIADTPATGTDT